MSETLAASLFKAVELEQGRAFISDGLGCMSDAEIVAIARGSLMHSRRVVRKLEQWLKRNGHITKRRYISSR